MPDNTGNQKNRIEDKAWMDMSNRLDQVLPLGNGRSNRERLLLILLLLITIGLGSYVAYLRNDIDSTKEKNSNQETLFAAKDQVKQEMSLSGKLNQIDNIVESKESLKDNKEDSENLIEVNSVGIIPQKNLLLAEKLEEKSIEANRDNVIETNQDNVEIDKSINEEFVELLGDEIQDVNKIGQERSLEIIPNVSNQSYIQYLSKVPEMLFVPNSLINIRPGICRNVFSLNAAMFSENMISFGGLEMGVGHQYNLNRHFALSSGLNFQMFSKEGFKNTLELTSFSNSIAPHLPENEFEDLSEYRYVYNVQNSEIVENEVGVEYLMGIVDKLYYLSLPLNIHYNRKSFSLFAGANMSLLLKGTNQVRDYSDQYFNTVILSKNVLAKRNYYNRLDIGIQAGFEVKLWRELSIYGRYNYGIFEIINSGSGSETNAYFEDRFALSDSKSIADRVDFNRFFTLGMKVNLNQCK